ncbi:MAG: hypothetical protein ACERKO_05610 [Acetanaerobacterium sp.]
MSVEIQKIQHEVYGSCLYLHNGAIELMVTLDYGPRILHFALAGEKNMLYNNNDPALRNSGEQFDQTYYKGAYWHTYGGHRLWVSPEVYPDTYYPDNDPVTYELCEGTVKLTCAPQIHNDVQYRFEITMDEAAPKVAILHRITNASGAPKTFAPWSITVMDQGGLEIVPMNTKNTGFLANRVISVWPYTNLACKRTAFSDRYFTLRQDPKIERAFKIGFDNEAGWACYVNHGALFQKSYTHVEGGSYPDNGCSYETYTNNFILEMETLGQLREYAPGETAEHTERWSLAPVTAVPDPHDGDAVDAFVKRYIG